MFNPPRLLSTLRIAVLPFLAIALTLAGCASAPVEGQEALQSPAETPLAEDAPKAQANLLPAPSAQLLATRVILTADIIEGAIALRRKLEGSRPQTLEELVPNYLYEVPRLPAEVEHPAYPEWSYLPMPQGATLSIFLHPSALEVARRINKALGLPEGPLPVEQIVIHPNFKGRAVIATELGLFFYVEL